MLLMQTPEEILLQYWQHDAFREGQREIIQSILDGNDTLALLPTGGGKSVCFQVPALMKEGLCLVISPLIALMKDQVNNLNNKNISAASLHSGLTFYEVKKTLQHAADGDYRFLYVSPERLESNLFLEFLRVLNISLLVVDEAHCISQWGYDFRPPYLRIASIREQLTNVPVLALTASATPVVQEDIIARLLFKQYKIFRQSFERANISYSVFKVDSKVNKLLEILNNVPGSSIVYCKSRRLAKETAQLLALHNISTGFYHAGLTQQERTDKQQAWIENNTRVMVCTNAFGMGIDKPDVRTVIHYDIPECLESYYQEAGRAGRDGNKAYTVLLYQFEDVKELEALPAVRFPLMYDIRKIYQALGDFLQIPVGLGEGYFYDFNLNEFIRNFKLEANLTINVLKVLEQEGYLSFNENIFLPSKVIFTASKNTLNNFELSQPQLEPLIKCLLRTYEGIIDNRVSVFEKHIARLCRLTEEKVKEQLLQLQAFDIIEYLPQKETPQIQLLTNRAPAKFLAFNHEAYLKRRQQYELRIQVMMQYINLQKQCRSRFIANYFGDKQLKDCGVCDNCLQQKNSSLTSEEFNNIRQTIYNHVPDNGIAVKELLQNLRAIKKEKMWKVIEYLQSERKLRIDNYGIMKRL